MTCARWVRRVKRPCDVSDPYIFCACLQGVRQRLAEEAVRVIVVDPFENNERARQLVSKSARYRSGYWVVKMFVWRFEEYTKMVYGKDEGLHFIFPG